MISISSTQIRLVSWRDPRHEDPNGNVIVTSSSPSDIKKDIIVYLYGYCMDGILIKYNNLLYICKSAPGNQYTKTIVHDHPWAYLLDLPFRAAH